MHRGILPLDYPLSFIKSDRRWLPAMRQISLSFISRAPLLAMQNRHDNDQNRNPDNK
jgi:hypothetical protein